jgi:hypothetical protein
MAIPCEFTCVQHVIPPALRHKRSIPLVLTMTSSREKSPLKLLALGIYVTLYSLTDGVAN